MTEPEKIVFYCACGCSRGKHHDSHKPADHVGHCHKCGAQACPKYKKDSDRNIKPTWKFTCLALKTVGVRFALAILLPWCATSTLTFVAVEYYGLHEDEYEVLLVIAFSVLAVQLVWFIIHYTLAKPLDELYGRVMRN